jgi:hypothetical protein
MNRKACLKVQERSIEEFRMDPVRHHIFSAWHAVKLALRDYKRPPPCLSSPNKLQQRVVVTGQLHPSIISSALQSHLLAPSPRRTRARVMASSSAMARAVLVAVVLMQCCNVMVAARPLLMEAPAVATADGGWLGMIMQVLQGPGGNPGGWQAPGHQP